jgi:hypothetical protein
MPLAAAPNRASGLVRWHETDMLTALPNVCTRGQSGKYVLALSVSGLENPSETLETWRAMSRLSAYRIAPTVIGS